MEAVSTLTKTRAKAAVFAAVKRGDLVRPATCSTCKRGGRIEGHHEDYAKPLVVVWLCKRCHIRAHRVISFADVIGPARAAALFPAHRAA